MSYFLSVRICTPVKAYAQIFLVNCFQKLDARMDTGPVPQYPLWHPPAQKERGLARPLTLSGLRHCLHHSWCRPRHFNIHSVLYGRKSLLGKFQCLLHLLSGSNALHRQICRRLQCKESGQEICSLSALCSDLACDQPFHRIARAVSIPHER